jgi:hypothetical protein
MEPTSAPKVTVAQPGEGESVAIPGFQLSAAARASWRTYGY